MKKERPASEGGSKVCGVTRLEIPARRAASLHAIQTVLSEMGFGTALKEDMRAAQERVFGDMNQGSQFHSSFNSAN
jgi:hypothetical protein